MMQKFNKAFTETIGYEGGYSFDPNDRGGETYRGISRKYWPSWKGWMIVDIYKKKYPSDVLTEKMNENNGLQNLVEGFYLENYWIPLQLTALDEKISTEIFDTAVNQGKTDAISYFQKALNKLNRNAIDFPDLIVDGKMGLKTLNAYRAYMATSRFASRNFDKLIKWIVRWLNYYQLQKYDQITYRDPAQEKFIPGWTDRC